jgi:protein O-GlcNAc transferase
LQLYAAGHSRRTDLLLLLGAAHYQLGQYEQCVAANDQCILLDPTLAEVSANRCYQLAAAVLSSGQG